jgi:DNA-binding CsgD family transcriptional regulator
MVSDFDGTVGEVLRLGWMGHFAVGRSMLAALLEQVPSTAGQRALCRALLALVCAALGDAGAARRFARQAIHDSARPPAQTPAEELRRLRLARALAVNASQLVGDVVRGRRAGHARFVAGDAESQSLMKAGPISSWADAPTTVQRYAKFVAAVHALAAQRARSGPLTAAESEILKLAAEGHSSVAIAARTGRSKHTVRTHLRNAYAKLQAHDRSDALARARALGLLAN